MSKSTKVRVIDFDGMGGSEYEFYCSSCHKRVEYKHNFCPHCGVNISEIEKRDSWGYYKKNNE